jgi:hypothetical protein
MEPPLPQTSTVDRALPCAPPQREGASVRVWRVVQPLQTEAERHWRFLQFCSHTNLTLFTRSNTLDDGFNNTPSLRTQRATPLPVLTSHGNQRSPTRLHQTPERFHPAHTIRSRRATRICARLHTTRDTRGSSREDRPRQ